MANRFQIDITARDRTSEALKSVNDNFAKIGKGTALERVQRGFADIVGRSRAFGDVGRSLASLGASGTLASGGIGEAAGGMAELAGAAGLAAGGAVAAGAAVAKWEAAYSSAGASIGRVATVLGMSTTQLQQYEIAGHKFGVTTQAMDGALMNLGQTLQDAVAGRNQPALVLLTKLGVTIHRLPNGAIDAARAMNDLSKAMARQNPQTRNMIAQQFGLTGAINFLTASSKDQQKALDAAARSGAIRTQAEINQDQKLQASMDALHDRWTGLLNVFERRIGIPVLDIFVDKLSSILTLLDDIFENKKGGLQKKVTNFESRLAVEAHAVLGTPLPAGSGGPAAKPLAGAEAGRRRNQLMAFFMSKGWSREQAAGIVANIERESGYRADVYGDNGEAYGLGQWHADRQGAFARRYGKNIRQASLMEEADFYNYELTGGSEQAAGRRLRGARSAAEAGQIVSMYDERPADRAGEAAARGQLAANIAGKVHVDVNLRGAPPGTTAQVATTGDGVTAGARIAPSMPGASI
ncbi:MAG TPA: phage tail tip lysozyme [Caulobacteraceae bacterium]|nr:phage tail tip lysozyme [Caulobacteraceae bacterium]